MSGAFKPGDPNRMIRGMSEDSPSPLFVGEEQELKCVDCRGPLRGPLPWRTNLVFFCIGCGYARVFAAKLELEGELHLDRRPEIPRELWERDLPQMRQCQEAPPRIRLEVRSA